MPDYRTAVKDSSAEVREVTLLAASKAGIAEDDPIYALFVGMTELVNAKTIGTNGEVKGIQDRLSELARTVEYIKAPETKPSNVWRRVASRIGIAALLLALGFLAGVLYISHEADARVDRVINAQPYELHALLLLKSKGGSLAQETIEKGPQQGIVLRHGQLPEPWISGDASKAAVIPLP
jgi:hypothetical protein